MRANESFTSQLLKSPVTTDVPVDFSGGAVPSVRAGLLSALGGGAAVRFSRDNGLRAEYVFLMPEGCSEYLVPRPDSLVRGG
jgi:hypothetical protein